MSFESQKKEYMAAITPCMPTQIEIGLNPSYFYLSKDTVLFYLSRVHSKLTKAALNTINQPSNQPTNPHSPHEAHFCPFSYPPGNSQRRVGLEHRWGFLFRRIHEQAQELNRAEDGADCTREHHPHRIDGQAIVDPGAAVGKGHSAHGRA